MQLSRINSLVFFLLAIISIIVTNSVGDSNYGIMSLIFLAFALMFYILERTGERMILALYLLAIYTFLASRQIIDFFRGIDFIYGYSNEVCIKATNCIFISCFFVYLGFLVDDSVTVTLGFKLKMGHITDKICDSCSVERVNIISYYLLFVSTITGFLLSVKKVLFVVAHGYLSVYGYSDSFSAMAQRFWLVSRAALFIYLATKPQKNKLRLAIILGSVDPIIELIIGRRGNSVSYVMFCVFFFAIYRDEKLIAQGRKTRSYVKYILIVIFAVLALPLLYSYGYTRAGMSYKKYTNLFDGIVKFFYQNGNSYNVLAITIEKYGNLPQKWYSLGIWRDIFTGVLGEYRDHTMAFAMNSSQLRAIVSAYYNKYIYLKGQGIGSSYIAEFYYDFGYVGVVIVNFFIGIVLSKARKIDKTNFIDMSLLLSIIYDIFLLPRAPFVTPISNILSTSTITTYIFIIVLNLKRKRSVAANTTNEMGIT